MPQAPGLRDAVRRRLRPRPHRGHGMVFQGLLVRLLHRHVFRQPHRGAGQAAQRVPPGACLQGGGVRRHADTRLVRDTRQGQRDTTLRERGVACRNAAHPVSQPPSDGLQPARRGGALLRHQQNPYPRRCLAHRRQRQRRPGRGAHPLPVVIDVIGIDVACRQLEPGGRGH